jgi:proteic killer suppression protein
VEVRFRTRKLEKQYQSHKEAERAYGQEVARKYIQRVNIIKQARNIEELKALPGLRCHPQGDRQGHWAINLTGSIV